MIATALKDLSAGTRPDRFRRFFRLYPLALTISMLAQAQSPARIEYSLDKNDGYEFDTLRATDSGKIYTLIDQSKKSCLQIVDQRDWDGNGLIDALVRHVNACGGNGAEDSFFIVSAFGNGRFQLSDEFGYTSNDPVIEKWKNRWSAVVVSNNEGFNNTQRPEEIKERFVLDAGKAVGSKNRDARICRACWKYVPKSLICISLTNSIVLATTLTATARKT